MTSTSRRTRQHDDAAGAAPPTAEEHVVLVDADDVPVGTRAKQQAHIHGLLHRAFSIFIFDAHGRTLLQRRAFGKYHSGGLWSNTCCSHPRPGESVHAAATRRLLEEMGFVCPLEPAFKFIYRAEVGDGLIEHELDHVLIGRFEGAPAPAAEEVADWRWVDVITLDAESNLHPQRFTHWFHHAWSELKARSLI